MSTMKKMLREKNLLLRVKNLLLREMLNFYDVEKG
jgi:hypothetical protein